MLLTILYEEDYNLKDIYLDNAATSRNKPESVVKAMNYYMNEIGCSPGRGGYECSLQASRIILDTRIILTELFNVKKPEQIIFSHNVTYAVNTAIKGLIQKGDHVISTTMDHNSVLRPLKSLEEQGIIEVDFVEADRQGVVNLEDVERSIRNNTKMIVLTHASNVTGTLMPVAEIGEIAKDNNLYYILDTAQSAGVYDIDFARLHLDVLCFTGHKCLMGPTGTGGFAVSEETAKEMDPLIEGGTGSISDKEYQPDFLPDKFESGTINTVGLAGLKAGIEYINNVGRVNIKNKLNNLTARFLTGLKQISRINIHGPGDINLQASTVSITIDGFDSGELSYLLADKYKIMTRSGLHCAPLAHKSIGTFPEGTIRFSIGYFNTVEEIDYTLSSLQEIVKS